MNRAVPAMMGGLLLLVACLAYSEEVAPRKPGGLRFGLTSPGSPSSAKQSRPPSATPAEPTEGAKPAIKAPKQVPSLDEMILFQPRKNGNWTPSGLKFRDVEFEAVDRTKLHAWYCPAETPRAVVLYCHGNSGNIAWLAEFLEFVRTRHQLSVLAFDYRGYGKSVGTPTVEGVLADGRAARAKCSELAGVPETEIVLWGRSMGGAVAVQLASEERPRGLILECTFDSFKTVAKHHVPQWAFLVPDERLNSVRQIHQVTCPLFQVHGTVDRVVPYQSGQTLYQAANEPKFFLTLPEADHNTPPPARMYDQIGRFIDLQCPVGKAP